MDQNTAEFPLQDRLWAWFEENKKRVGIGLAVAAVLGVILGYHSYSQEKERIAAGEDLSKALLTGFAAGNGQPATPESLLKVAADHPSSGSAAQAVLLAASAYFVQGKYAEAQSQFRRFLAEFPGDPFSYQAMFGIAASLDAQNKRDEALKAYGDVVNRYPSSPVAPRARFAIAELNEAEGKFTDAATIYESLSRGEFGSGIAAEATYRLRQIAPKLPKEPETVPEPEVSSLSLPSLSTPLTNPPSE